MTDPYVGQLSFVRVYSGTLEAGSYVYNSTKGKKERVGRLLRDARQQARRDRGGLRRRHRRRGRPEDTTTGDTLCDENKPIVLESMDFPEPVISSRSSRRRKADQEKLGVGAQPAGAGRSDVPGHDRSGDRPDDHRRHGRAAPRDHRRPHEARVQRRGQRRQAAGGLPRDDPRRRPRPRASTSGRPAAAASTVTSRSRSSRCEPASGFVFENEIVGGVDPEGVHQGRSRRASRKRWSAACWPAIRWSTSRSTLIDGCTTRSTRSEMASRSPARWRFKDAASKAKPVLLEPIMRRSGRAGGVHGRGHRRPERPARPDRGDGARAAAAQVITRHVPLSEMFGYATDLRSMTQGRATYTMHFEHYEEVPQAICRRDHREGRRASQPIRAGSR